MYDKRQLSEYMCQPCKLCCSMRLLLQTLSQGRQALACSLPVKLQCVLVVRHTAVYDRHGADMHSGSFVKQRRTHANIQQSGGPNARGLCLPYMQSRRPLACRCGRQYYSHEHANHSQCQQQLYRSPPAGLLAVTSLGSRDPPPSLEPCLACWRPAVLKPMCAQSSSTCKAGDADLAHKTTYKTAARGRAQARTPQGWRHAPCSRTRPVLQWVPHGFRNGSRAALGGQAGPPTCSH